jgi:hypothetical protein
LHAKLHLFKGFALGRGPGQTIFLDLLGGSFTYQLPPIVPYARKDRAPSPNPFEPKSGGELAEIFAVIR